MSALPLAESFCFPLHRLTGKHGSEFLYMFTHMFWIPQLGAEMQKFNTLALLYSSGSGSALTQQHHTSNSLQGLRLFLPLPPILVILTAQQRHALPFHSPSSPITPAPASSAIHTTLCCWRCLQQAGNTCVPASLDLMMIFSSTRVSLEHWKDTKKGKTETNLPWHVDQSRNIQGFGHIHWHHLEKDWGCFEATRDTLLLRIWEERCHLSVPLSVKLCFQRHIYKMECVVPPQVLRKPVDA